MQTLKYEERVSIVIFKYNAVGGENRQQNYY